MRQLGKEVVVHENDRINPEEVLALQPEGIVLSPGPATPSQAGNMNAIIEACFQTIPILGICLGHQALGAFFGAELVKGAAPVHGKTALVRHSGTGIYEDLPNPLQVMRYHSLVLEKLPESLEITGATPEKVVMSFRHKTLPITGVQFHPESILTPNGLQMLANWVR